MTEIRIEGAPQVVRSATNPAKYDVTFKLAGARVLTGDQLRRLQWRLQSALSARTSNLLIGVVVDGENLVMRGVTPGTETSIYDTADRVIVDEDKQIAKDRAALEADAPARLAEAKRLEEELASVEEAFRQAAESKEEAGRRAQASPNETSSGAESAV